jgi:CHASE3 domain sensor protein
MDPRKARETLRKQGIFIHENDPVLDVAALCDVTMIDTLKAIEGVVKAAADRTSAAAAQSIDASKETAEAVISQGAAFLVEQFRDVVRDATGAMLAELRQETAKATRASRLATRIAWGLAVLVAIGLAGLGGFLLAALRHG